MDYIVFSHLRWNFVFQRPQHLMSRCAKSNRIFFWEEPYFDSDFPSLETTQSSEGITVVVPHLPRGLSEVQTEQAQRRLLKRLIQRKKFINPIVWYYNPMAVRFSQVITAGVVVYDCMDELSGFRGAPPGLQSAEAELFEKADVVFTGGRSLYEVKRRQHHFVHCFPSSIDREFFVTSRTMREQPEDQAGIPRPRLGYSGVIDERMDFDLVREAAQFRPDWHFVMLGPVVKVSEAELPRAANIHWLGGKKYQELPAYMAGWDVGLLPFARNESTRFISPTKTPEYLAAGLPVVSTPITDVVEPYGVQGLALIAHDSKSFVAMAERALAERDRASRLASADKFLQQMSWDLTWQGMEELVARCIKHRRTEKKYAVNVGIADAARLYPGVAGD